MIQEVDDVQRTVVGPTQESGARPSLPLTTLREFEIPAAILLITAVMAAIQFGGPAILDNDGYYHIRWSAMLRESFPNIPEFKALPLTTLDEKRYVDHHYLYHVMLFPFTLGDLRTGAKIAAVVFSSLAIGSLFALFWFYRIKWRWFWLAPLIASSEPFLYRMSMTRAPALSLALLGIGTFLILTRRFVLLGLLSFAFAWSYSMFPLMIVFALAYGVTIYLSERRIDLWAVLASATGAVAGMIVNPYFPRNVLLLYEHSLMKVSGKYTVDVGIEWYTYESFYMVTSSAVAFAIFFLGLAAFNYRDRLRDPKPLFFLIVSTVLLLMTIRWRRFMEYFPPFAVVFGAFSIAPKLASLDLAWLRSRRDRAIASIAAAVVVVVSVATMVSTVLQARNEVKEETDPYTWRDASQYIGSHAEPGSLVFNTNWDTFPALFYYNPQFGYVSGLDPTYLHDSDPDRWRLYESINAGDREDAARLILEEFGAAYVVTENGDSNFLSTAESDSGFEKVYEDWRAVVLRVRDAKERSPE
jgi:hypothetical protein